MESVNYTYERVPHIKNGETYYGRKTDLVYKTWAVINKKGRMIAEATSQKNAELIVAALNGVAP